MHQVNPVPMSRIGRKIICAMLALLLVLSGQVAMSAQDMEPVPELAKTDCGQMQMSAGDEAEPAGMSPGCGQIDNMDCMTSSGTSHCVMTMVLACGNSYTLTEAPSQKMRPGAVSGYKSPLLDVITPPPQLRS